MLLPPHKCGGSHPLRGSHACVALTVAGDPAVYRKNLSSRLPPESLNLKPLNEIDFVTLESLHWPRVP